MLVFFSFPEANKRTHHDCLYLQWVVLWERNNKIGIFICIILNRRKSCYLVCQTQSWETLCVYIEWTTIRFNGQVLGIFITTAICHSVFQNPGLPGTFQAVSHWPILMTSYITNPVREVAGTLDALKKSTFQFIQNRTMCFRGWEISTKNIKGLLESNIFLRI